MTTKTPKPMSDDTLVKAVRAAFAKLRSDGLEPSARNVRAITGGKQSRVLAAIQSVREEEEARRKRLEAVPPMPADLSDALEGIWEVAWKSADENAAEARNSFALRIADLEKQNEECLAALSQLEEENESLAAAKSEIERSLSSATENSRELKTQVEHLQLRLDERAEIMRFMEEKTGTCSVPTAAKRVPSKSRSQTGELPLEGFDVGHEMGASA